MTRATRIALGAAGLAIGIAVAGAAPASAQVQFYGSFPVPFGRITVGVPGPAFALGAFVPYGHVVSYDPYYGYGFVYGNQWISCRPYGRRWIVANRRPFYGWSQTYGGHSRHGSQRWTRHDDRHFDHDRQYGSRSLDRDRGFHEDRYGNR